MAKIVTKAFGRILMSAFRINPWISWLDVMKKIQKIY